MGGCHWRRGTVHWQMFGIAMYWDSSHYSRDCPEWNRLPPQPGLFLAQISHILGDNAQWDEFMMANYRQDDAFSRTTRAMRGIEGEIR
jgi:hypothetical protein